MTIFHALQPIIEENGERSMDCIILLCSTPAITKLALRFETFQYEMTIFDPKSSQKWSFLCF